MNDMNSENEDVLSKLNVIYVGSDKHRQLSHTDFDWASGFEIERLVDYDAVIIQGASALRLLRDIRRDSRVAVYLIPVYYDQGIRKKPSEEILELCDEWVGSDNIERFVAEHSAQITAIRNSINEFLQQTEGEIARDLDMGLRTLRFHYTRNKPLQPLRNPLSRFGYSYPLLDANLPEDSFQKFGILDYLQGRHLIQGEFVDRVHLCPHCYSAHLNFREICPKCSSPSLRQQDLIHHFACGNISPESDYRKDENLICPKCRKLLRNVGVDFDRPSAVYECNACDHPFQEPNVESLCFHCGKIIVPEDLLKHDIQTYRITSMGENSALFGVILSFREALKNELDIVDLETFRLVTGLEKSRIVRYDKSESSVGILELGDISAIFDKLGSGSVSGLLSDISQAIKSTIRTSDLISFLSETAIVVLFTETGGTGIRIVMNRLQERIQDVLQNSVSIKNPVEIEFHPVDKEFSLDKLLARYASE
jgi:GGDEF domain-containing protein